MSAFILRYPNKKYKNMKTLNLSFQNFFRSIEDKLGWAVYLNNDDLLLLEVPGFGKEDLKITLDGYRIRINGKKNILGEEIEIDKILTLPEGSLNTNDPITAKVENGLLYISLKKSERSRQTEIKIL